MWPFKKEQPKVPLVPYTIKDYDNFNDYLLELSEDDSIDNLAFSEIEE